MFLRLMLASPLSVGLARPIRGVEGGTRNAAVPEARSIQDAIRRRPDGMPESRESRSLCLLESLCLSV